jgi:hypothetical protein
MQTRGSNGNIGGQENNNIAVFAGALATGVALLAALAGTAEIPPSMQGTPQGQVMEKVKNSVNQATKKMQSVTDKVAKSTPATKATAPKPAASAAAPKPAPTPAPQAAAVQVPAPVPSPQAAAPAAPAATPRPMSAEEKKLLDLEAELEAELRALEKQIGWQEFDSQ